MAQNDREIFFQGFVSGCPFIDVEVAPTDPDPFHLDQNFVGLGRRNRKIENFDPRRGFGLDDGLHGSSETNLLKDHFLHLDPFDGLQFFLHLENFLFIPVHFQEDETRGGANLFAHLMEAQAGLDVTALLGKYSLFFEHRAPSCSGRRFALPG